MPTTSQKLVATSANPVWDPRGVVANYFASVQQPLGGAAVSAPAPSPAPSPSPSPPPAVPSYLDPSAALPGWLDLTPVNGAIVTMDFGAPLNGATSFAWALYRDGGATAIASGTSTSRYQTFQTTSADSTHTLSVLFTPSNAVGAGVQTLIGGLYVQ